jgi:negative regulator of sigma E activity
LGQHDARRAGRAWVKTGRRGRVLIAASTPVVVALVILGVVHLTRGPSLAGQAQSTSLTQMRSFNRQHAEADAAVEREVKLVRQALRLPPPDTD